MERIGIYIGVCILVVQLVSMVYGLKQKRLEGAIGIAISSVVINAALSVYYNQLPGKGEAPGLTYFGETVLQMGFTLVAAVMLAILLLVVLLRKKKL